MDGGRTLPPSKQQLIQALIEEGATLKSIVEEVKCSRATVFNYKHNLKDFGMVLAPSQARIGRPPSLTEEMVEVSMLLFSSNEQEFLPQSVLTQNRLGFEAIFERQTKCIPR